MLLLLNILCISRSILTASHCVCTDKVEANSFPENIRPFVCLPAYGANGKPRNQLVPKLQDIFYIIGQRRIPKKAPTATYEEFIANGIPTAMMAFIYSEKIFNSGHKPDIAIIIIRHFMSDGKRVGTISLPHIHEGLVPISCGQYK